MTFKFVPFKVASQAITKTIKQQFLNPWPSCEAILEKDKDHFWQCFKVTCSKCFKCSKHFKDLLFPTSYTYIVLNVLIVLL